MKTKQGSEANYGAITVIGIGAFGISIVNHLIESGLGGVKFVCIDSDVSLLETSKAHVNFIPGEEFFNPCHLPEVEKTNDLYDAINDNPLIFMVVDGEQGDSADVAIEIVRICKRDSLLRIAIVPIDKIPGPKIKNTISSEWLTILQSTADTIIPIIRDRIAQDDIWGNLQHSCTAIQQVIYHLINAVVDVVVNPRFVSVDFSDILYLFSSKKVALVGFGKSSGPNRAAESTEKALSHPFLRGISLPNVQSVYMNVAFSKYDDFQALIDEIRHASDIIFSRVNPDANLVMGTSIDATLDDSIQVTVVIVGLELEEVWTTDNGREVQDS